MFSELSLLREDTVWRIPNLVLEAEWKTAIPNSVRGVNVCSQFSWGEAEHSIAVLLEYSVDAPCRDSGWWEVLKWTCRSGGLGKVRVRWCLMREMQRLGSRPSYLSCTFHKLHKTPSNSHIFQSVPDILAAPYRRKAKADFKGGARGGDLMEGARNDDQVTSESDFSTSDEWSDTDESSDFDEWENDSSSESSDSDDSNDQESSESDLDESSNCIDEGSLDEVSSREGYAAIGGGVKHVESQSEHHSQETRLCVSVHIVRHTGSFRNYVYMF